MWSGRTMRPQLRVYSKLRDKVPSTSSKHKQTWTNHKGRLLVARHGEVEKSNRPCTSCENRRTLPHLATIANRQALQSAGATLRTGADIGRAVAIPNQRVLALGTVHRGRWRLTSVEPQNGPARPPSQNRAPTIRRNSGQATRPCAQHGHGEQRETVTQRARGMLPANLRSQTAGSFTTTQGTQTGDSGEPETLAAPSLLPRIQEN